MNFLKKLPEDPNAAPLPIPLTEKQKALELRNHRLKRTAEFQFGYPLVYIYGPDSKAREDGEGPEVVDKYNGIIAHPRGYAAQFVINFKPKGEKVARPMILTMASQDPSNLGTYDPERGEFVLDKKNIKDRTYIVSVRSPEAPLAEFQKDIIDHFRHFQKYQYDLNLLGQADNFMFRERAQSLLQGAKHLITRGKNPEESFYFGQYLSKHVAYAVVQVSGGDDSKYVVLKRYGPGKLDYDSPTYTIFNKSEIDVRALRQGRAPFNSEFVSFEPEEEKGPDLANKEDKADKKEKVIFFDNTTLANIAVSRDFGVCFKRLWNMEHASEKILIQIPAFLNNSLRTGSFGTSIVRGILATGSISLANNLINYFSTDESKLSISLLPTFALATLVDFSWGKVGDNISDFLLNGWRADAEDRSQRKLIERALRNYADEFSLEEHLKVGRPLKKLKEDFAGKAVRLMGVRQHPETATSMFLPIDPIVPTMPEIDETNPLNLFLANVTGGTAGNLSRDVSPKISLGTTPTGMVAMSIVDDFNIESGFGSKPNSVVKYVAFVPAFQLDIENDDIPSSTDISMRSEQPKRKMQFKGIEEHLGGKVAKIIINRRDSSFTIKPLDIEEFKGELLEVFNEHVPEIAPLGTERIFYGLGHGEDALKRLQTAFGLPPEGFPATRPA